MMHTLSAKYDFRSNVLVLSFFFVAVHLLYWPTWQAGFVTDFTGLQERLEGAHFSGFLTSFGFPALHQVTNFFLFIFYYLFDTSPLPWYLVYTCLHIANGWLGYRLASKLFCKAGFEHITRLKLGHEIQLSIPAFAASLLFLLSPYNAETVVWKVCFNFLFSAFLMLTALLHLTRYLEKGRTLDLISLHLLFVVALFTFELALAFPFMALVFLFFWNEKKIVQKRLLPIPGFHFLAIVIYFFINKIWLGSWVGHYGEDVHLKFNLNVISSNSLKYFSKNLLYWRDWPHAAKETFIHFLDMPVVGISAFFIGVAVLIYFIMFFKKNRPAIKAAFFSWLLFFLALIPVANLFTTWLLHGENDRYGYFSSLFFYIGLISLLQVFNKKGVLFTYSFFLITSIIYLNRINSYWENSTNVVNELLADFRWEKSPAIYVLAFPENYKGIPMFKDFSRKDLALKHALKYNAEKKPKGEIYQVAQFNMNRPDDGFLVTSDSNHIAKLEFKEWGSWWWRHGIGTGSYETDKYVFKTVAKGCEIKIKEAAEGAVFIYADGGMWKEVSFE